MKITIKDLPRKETKTPGRGLGLRSNRHGHFVDLLTLLVHVVMENPQNYLVDNCHHGDDDKGNNVIGHNDSFRYGLIIIRVKCANSEKHKALVGALEALRLFFRIGWHDVDGACLHVHPDILLFSLGLFSLVEHPCCHLKVFAMRSFLSEIQILVLVSDLRCVDSDGGGCCIKNRPGVFRNLGFYFTEFSFDLHTVPFIGSHYRLCKTCEGKK